MDSESYYHDYDANFEPLWDNSISETHAAESHLLRSRIEVCDPTALLQAVVFVEDAVQYRSINHKIDPAALWYYRFYYSKPVQWFLKGAILLILLLAFIEPPSSFTATSDPRYRGHPITVPCWTLDLLEGICLLTFLADVTIKSCLIGKKQFIKEKWLIAYMIIVTMSFADWFVTINFGCNEKVRFRRILRPFFLLQNSTLMKKTIRSIKSTLPKIASVLLLLTLHIFVFCVFGMLLFPTKEHDNNRNKTQPVNIVAADHFAEGSKHFSNITTSFISLLVLLTTANNPDVMMPAYKVNRLYSLYFIVFLVIGLYFFFNMLTAVIYNEFRGYLLRSMQASHFRRRLGFQAAFEMLRRQGSTEINAEAVSTTVSASVVKSVVVQTKIKRTAKAAIIRELDNSINGSFTAHDFQQLFDMLDRETYQRKPPMKTTHHPLLRKIQAVVTHRFFNYFGAFVASVNVLIISVEVAIEDTTIAHQDHYKLFLNITFVVYYCLEQIVKAWALGWRRYKASRMNMFDLILTVVLFIFMIVTIVSVVPDISTDKPILDLPLYELTRIVNMLIIFRLLRVITMFETMAVVAGTLIDLLRNLKAFIGIMVVIYYCFAILGMELFQNVIPVPPNSTHINFECGSYEQLDYWANNFDDFASTIVVLWDVMVVNNWHVFLDAYSRYSVGWARLYFIAWYLTSVIVFMNVFTAIILENFITKWDRRQQQQEMANAREDDPDQTPNYLVSVHTMFREDLKEPSEAELLHELLKHPHIHQLRV